MPVLKSLRSRIVALALLVCTGSVAIGGLLIFATYDARDAFRWVRHTQDVIIELDMADSNVLAAEAGVRGYFLTGSADDVVGFDRQMADAIRATNRVRTLVADNADQQQRATLLVALVDQRLRALNHLLQKVRAANSPLSQDPARAARARALAKRIATTTAAMRKVEKDLLTERLARARRVSRLTDMLAIMSAPAFILIVCGVAIGLVVSIERPLFALLNAVARFGDGERDARVRLGSSGTEFARLGAAYNAMADSLVLAMKRQERSEEALARANGELLGQAATLKQRSESIEIVSGMSQRLQALREPNELAEVLQCFLPQILPNVAGQLYLFNNSRNLLARAASWGATQESPETFAPEDCWALRRGHAHLVTSDRRDVPCKHGLDETGQDQLCKPVMAGGQILGLFYIQGMLEPEDRFRLVLLVENVALALVNENLRKRLREQSIRDPLTGLFNRRYLEEALALESARSNRGETPLSVIMADVDHFKRFNDTHGHPAGDALLKELAGVMQTHFRDGDIICRYGGEEFAIIAPGADQDLIIRRAEALRRAAHDVRLTFEGRELGPISMSFGVASYGGGGRIAGQDLIATADEALYRAKRAGRDRVELGQLTPAYRKMAA